MKELVSLFCWCCYRLEERQRAEKRIREAKDDMFTPKWFDLSDEVTPTPWGDLEVYRYNGKYSELRATLDNSESLGEINPETTEFNPWQYEDSAAEWVNHAMISYDVFYALFDSLCSIIIIIVLPSFNCDRIF